MDPWTEGARKILERSPTRAAPLSRLLTGLQEEGVEVRGREAWILKRISEEPALFRILPDRGSPFHRWPLTPTPEPSARHGRHRFGDPWILARPAPPPSFGIRKQTVRRIQESLGAWGHCLDDGSPIAVARWVRATREAEETCSLILTERAEQV